MGETWKASAVFSMRLREKRRDRGLSQRELAKRMTEAGRPLSKTSLQGIETGGRGLRLDTAIALAAELYAPPAKLLCPPNGATVQLTGKRFVDGDGMQNWLRTGWAIRVAPLKPRGEDLPLLEANFERGMTRHAAALLDSIKAKDDTGKGAALKAIADLMDGYRQTVLDHERGILDGRLPSSDDHVFVIGG